jgi:hypothetical protein
LAQGLWFADVFLLLVMAPSSPLKPVAKISHFNQSFTFAYELLWTLTVPT